MYDDIAVSGVVREALVRVVQEAVINAGRHGGASVVDLTLSNSDGVHMVVTDNGSGFDPSLVLSDSCFGLTSMRERIEGLGGHIEITSTPGGGARVEAHLP
jgi:signal transduction histidine kinase